MRGSKRSRQEEKKEQEEKRRAKFARNETNKKEKRKEKRTSALPGQPAPEHDVGEGACEGRDEGHERGCVDGHCGGTFF